LRAPDWNYHHSWEKNLGGKLGYVSMDTTFLVLFATTLKQEENSFNMNYAQPGDNSTRSPILTELYTQVVIFDHVSRRKT
ncbi:hypothetical protein M91_03636, partial [Bos mutus]